MRKEWLNKKYRHIYRYVCDTCGKTRTTLSHERSERKQCTHCEPQKVDPNQVALPL